VKTIASYGVETMLSIMVLGVGGSGVRANIARRQEEINRTSGKGESGGGKKTILNWSFRLGGEEIVLGTQPSIT